MYYFYTAKIYHKISLMSFKLTARIFLFFSIFFVSETYSIDINNKADSKSKESLKSEIKDYINHHLKDSHDFNLFSFTNEKHEHIYIVSHYQSYSGIME